MHQCRKYLLNIQISATPKVHNSINQEYKPYMDLMFACVSFDFCLNHATM